MKVLLFCVVGLFAVNKILDVQGQSVTKHCYGQTCPQNTTFCLKTLNTTADGQEIETEVDCLDSNFTTVASFNHSKANYFGPELSLEGWSFSTVHEVPANTVIQSGNNATTSIPATNTTATNSTA